MKPIKIKVHSSVDLITNSSTTIFTFSEGSVDAVKELVNEMLKVFNEPYKKFDDIFYAGVFADEYYDCYDENDEEYEEDFIEEIKMKVLKGEIEKPEWMSNFEDEERTGTVLEIMPKDEKYADLAKKLIDFLYSTHAEESYEG